LSLTAERLGLPILIPIGALLIAISNLGASGAYLTATARLPFVAGIDHYLPPAFGRLHPRWKTPHVALWTQSIAGMIFIFLGQAGTSVKGAYDVLVSMSTITYFIPYLFVFASMIALQREPAGPDVIRVPGGRLIARRGRGCRVCDHSLHHFSLAPASAGRTQQSPRRVQDSGTDGSPARHWSDHLPEGEGGSAPVRSEKPLIGSD